MSIKWTQTKDWHIARFREANIDERNMDSEGIISYIESLPRGSKVAVSFRRVEWISSRVLGMLVSALKTVEKREGQFAITSPSDKILEALRITKLDRALTIKPSTNDLE